MANYLMPILYPQGLTREAQVALGLVVLAINVVLYGRILLGRRAGVTS